MKQLSRKKIQDMIDLNGANISSRRSSGGSGGAGGGGVSSAWVDEHYVSKDFFARLFTINGTDENDDDVVVEPNDLETTITNIQLMFGAWTEQYLSALGQGSGGGGGGSILTEPLATINTSGLGNPSSANQVLVWTGSAWAYRPYTTGSGTVTSVALSVPTGFKVSGGTSQAITSSGTFALAFDTGYSLPTTDKQTNWDTAYTWVNTNGASTVSKTAWGRTYWNEGAPQNISGDIENAANIQIDNDKKISWKQASASNYLSMLTLDSSNNFIVGESMANSGFTTYLRGRNITLQTGTGNSGNHSASLDANGVLTVEKLVIGSITISHDSTNGGLHIESAGLYADTYISALSAGSGGSASGITMADVWTAMAAPAPSTAQEQIEASHLTQALSGYASKTWANNRFVTQGTEQTITGNKSFTGNLSFGSGGKLTASNGAKFQSVCIECNGSGSPANRYGEINRYSGQTLHLQYDSGTGGVSMCQNKLNITYTSSTNRVTLSCDSLFISAQTFSGSASYTSSDMRLKDVINPVTASVEDIANVRIFDFRWKKDGENGKIHFGSAAQDWENIFPSAVVADKEGFLYMDYAGIAVGAVKTVAQEVVLLKNRVAELEKQLKAS